MGWNLDLYLRLSAMMFLEYAVWGAWMPVLAVRLLGPLKMSGKQTGWIYATLPLAAMISPLVAGPLADSYVDTRWILVAAHLAGAVLLFIASRTRSFGSLFVVMLLYSFCYAATIPLVNSVMFRHLEEAHLSSSSIFIWAPIAWALVGYSLTGYRSLRGGAGDGSDCLVFAGLLSIVMVVACALQPATPPLPQQGGESALLQALAMLKEAPFAIFMIVQLVVGGMMQFYFLGTAQFLQDRRISGSNVPAIMAIAQAVQAAATFFVLAPLLNPQSGAGPQWTLAIGAACWMTLFLVYLLPVPRAILVIAQSLHGLAYVFFIIAGQIYVSDVAPKAIGSSAQSLIIFVQTGIGLFLGTQLAGFVMDRNSVGGKFQWSKVFAVPFLACLAGVIVMAAMAVMKPIPAAAAPAAPAAAAPASATTLPSAAPSDAAATPTSAAAK